ncbi:MAG TPA: endonuclease/exonuclease/phosphatase family protein [Polyangiaceae bacterium]
MRSGFIVLACSYPFVLAALACFIRYFDANLWLAAVALYLPRFPLLFPIPVFVALFLFVGRRKLVWTQALALAVVLFPLMGLTVPSYPRKVEAAPPIRILSFNIDSGYAGPERIAAAIERSGADIVVLQESRRASQALEELLGKRYPHVQQKPYSLVFSRFPIVEVSEHEKLTTPARRRSGRFQRHVIAAPTGPFALYNVHPISPRGTLSVRRFRTVLHVLRNPTGLSTENIRDLEQNVELRRQQMEAVANMARGETLPVILAGDFNLPELSGVFETNLGDFQDGFQIAGSGFGYTFPAELPWMRLDRILASHHFRFVTFSVNCEGLSDHRCVTASLERTGEP